MKFFVIALYMAILLFLGYISMKKTKTLNDFYLGGRNIGPWVSALSYGTSYFSAVIFIGYAGKSGWGFGLSVLWIVLGNAIIGSYLAWKLLARPTRAMTIRLQASTMPEFLAKRYDSKGMKVFAALIIFVFLVPYCSSVYMGLSYFFESIFGIPYVYALFAIAIITAVYLVMGGYVAVNLTNLFQGIIMILGVGFLLYYVVESPQVGGWGEIIPRLSAIDPKLVAPVGPGGPVALFSLVLLTSLGTWGLPQMTQKFYAIKNEAVIKKATIVTFIFCLWIAFGAYFTGSLSHLFFTDLSAVGNNVDKIIPTMINMTLPGWVALLILLLVLSASMSTLASLVLVASSAVVMDLVQMAKPKIEQKKVVLLMRLCCVVFVAISLYLALIPNNIINLMSFSWGTIAGAFLAPYVLGLFMKGITKTAAWIGMISGVVLSIGLTVLLNGNTPLAGTIAMIAPLLIIPIVSKFTKPYSKEHIRTVFTDK